MIRFLLSVSAFVASSPVHALDYAAAFQQALQNNVPLVVGVGHEPTVPSGWVSSKVAAFDKMDNGGQVVLIPSNGSMWRVEVFGDLETSVAAIRTSWEIPDALDEVNELRGRRGLRRSSAMRA